MDITENITPEIFNASLIGGKGINSVYHELINNEIIAPSYSNKRKPGHFAVRKRKGYRRLNVDLKDYNVTDVEKIYRGGCNSGEYDIFFYTVSKDGSKYEIRRANNTDCEANPNSISKGCSCKCGYNKFLRTKYVSGDPRIISTTSNARTQAGTIYNKTYVNGALPEGRWYLTNHSDINYLTGTPTDEFDIKPGDYVLAIETGEVKRIASYDAIAKEIITDTPRTTIKAGDVTRDVTLQVFPKRGDVLLFTDCDGVGIIHPTGKTSDPYITRFQYISGKCVQSMTDVNGQRQFLTDEGFSIFGGVGLNLGVFAGSTNIGGTITQSVKFRKFNVFLGRNEVKVGTTTLSGNTYIQDVEDIGNGMGIWSKDAYTLFQNSFYMVGNNKRLYALSISKDGFGSLLELKDMSEYLKGDLDLLVEGDEISISADEREMKIYITNGVSTKILIYDNDYAVWHTHKSCCAVIRGYKEGFYIGGGLYKYCGMTDCNGLNTDGTIAPDKGYFYTQKLSAYIGDNEPNGMKFNLYQDKKLLWIKMTLGHSVINDTSTSLVITSHKGDYKSRYMITNWDRIKWIKDGSDIAAGLDVTIDPCILEDLNECNVIKNTCNTKQYVPLDRVHCDCPDEPINVGDYCVCNDNKGYYRSDAYNVFFKPEAMKSSTLYLVEFTANDGDSINTTGRTAGLTMENIEDHNKDKLDMLIPDCGMCNQTCENSASCS